ncbi:MAG TPA: ATP-binding protein, partial [Spirochaetales bacterium]|nr:ATP-binding protein [Spirochaetales bacterium]
MSVFRGLSSGRRFPAAAVIVTASLCLSLFVLQAANNEEQRRLVIGSYLDLERAVVDRIAATADIWFRSGPEGRSLPERENEFFVQFIDPIRVLRSGDAWIYTRDYVIYDESSDFPAAYRGKPIDEIFRAQAELGASHYESLVEGVLGAGSGEDWYVWLPEKGREWAVWKSVGAGGRAWTVGLSTPEKEIFEYYGVDDFARFGYGYCVVVSLCYAASCVLLIIWYRRRHALTEALAAAKLEAERANRAKGDFLAAVSHEIRTPLQGILGFLELMALGSLDERQKEELSIVDSSAKSLLAYVNDLLDYAKIERGMMELDAIAFDPADAAARVAKLFEAKAAEKGLRLELSCPAPPPACLGDPLRLGQVLMNLVGNAIKFTPAGGRVTIGLRAAEEGGRARLGFEVADTGIGIERGRQDSIFEAFTQADPSIARRFGGTGLGLSISSRLVALMGGRIEVESEIGKGSCFRFSILLPLAAAEPSRGEPSPAAAGLPSLPLRVLVAEDAPESRLLLERLLGRLGATAVTVEDGARALGRFKEERFDLVILDGYMPVMGGVEAAAAMRAFEAASDQARTPILALSAQSLDSEREGFLAAGADSFLRKPFTLSSLAAALRSLAPGAGTGTGTGT